MSLFLPNNYQQNPTKYKKFLITFGFHFFSTRYFGDFLTTKIEITQCFIKSMKDMKAEAEAIFAGLIILKLRLIFWKYCKSLK